jgi:hypothetical protein
MVDDGGGGDAAAGDGVYTFVLSGNLGKHDRVDDGHSSIVRDAALK